MPSALSKSSLAAPRREFLHLLQRLNFGRIERLVIRQGQPVLSPKPRIIREIKFGGENGPRPEQAKSDYLVKRQVVELFETFDELRDGEIELLDVKHGLPFRILLASPAQ